jgi:hypothetical protein
MAIKKVSLFVAIIVIVCQVQAQTPQNIIAELADLNNHILQTSCKEGKGPLISNRAMNLYLANKIGYFLSSYNDLSFYKNYVTYHSDDGTFSLNHNLFQAKKIDEPVRSFFVVGARASIKNTNEIGATAQHTWIGKTKTYFSKCELPDGSTENHKYRMDALRASILYALELEFNSEVAAFNKSLSLLRATDLPGQNLDTAKIMLTEKFYRDLSVTYAFKFADLQEVAFDHGMNYNTLTSNWTTLSAYVPFVTKRYIAASSPTEKLAPVTSYPWEAGISHSRLWESRKVGRFVLTVFTGIAQNNAVQAKMLSQKTAAEYLAGGGKDSAGAARMVNEKLYYGGFKNFITLLSSARLVYFPPSSHVGVSLVLEKYNGDYDPLNFILGIPITLVDKKGIPAADFQFQLKFTDLNNTLSPTNRLDRKLSVNLTASVPFSKIIY